MRSIVIGCDNAGFYLKEQLKEFLEDNGITCEDVGVDSSSDETMYPEVAKKLVVKITESGFAKDGILVCGTGLGMAISANKFPGIYAGVCHDNYSAERLRLSNKGNVICLGARVVGPELAKKIVMEWLNLEFKDGRSTAKVQKIQEFERDNFKQITNF